MAGWFGKWLNSRSRRVQSTGPGEKGPGLGEVSARAQNDTLGPCAVKGDVAQGKESQLKVRNPGSRLSSDLNWWVILDTPPPPQPPLS